MEMMNIYVVVLVEEKIKLLHVEKIESCILWNVVPISVFSPIVFSKVPLL